MPIIVAVITGCAGVLAALITAVFGYLGQNSSSAGQAAGPSTPLPSTAEPTQGRPHTPSPRTPGTAPKAHAADTQLLSSLEPGQDSYELDPGSFRLDGHDHPHSLYSECDLQGNVNITDYPLDGKYRKLTATVGITAGAADADAVGTFRIRKDGKPPVSYTATRDRPEKISLDVTGVERLTLESVDTVGDPLYCKVNKFVWGDPTLTASP